MTGRLSLLLSSSTHPGDEWTAYKRLFTIAITATVLLAETVTLIKAVALQYATAD